MSASPRAANHRDEHEEPEAVAAPRQPSCPASARRPERRLDVGDGEEHCLCRTRRSRREVYAKLDRAAGAGRRELDQAEVVTGGAVGIQPPSEP
jgi:hypothetical protein